MKRQEEAIRLSPMMSLGYVSEGCRVTPENRADRRCPDNPFTISAFRLIGRIGSASRRSGVTRGRTSHALQD